MTNITSIYNWLLVRLLGGSVLIQFFSAFLFVLVSLPSFSQQPSLVLSHNKESGVLRVALVNNLQKEVIVSDDLRLNFTPEGYREIFLAFRSDEGALEHGLDEARASHDITMFKLKPQMALSRDIPLDWLSRYYVLEKGKKYTVQAIYCEHCRANELHELKGLRSNILSITL